MKINDCFCDNVNFSQQINWKGWPKWEKNENRSNKNVNRDDCKWSFLELGQQDAETEFEMMGLWQLFVAGSFGFQ